MSDQEIKEAIQDGISFSVNADNAVIYINLDVLIQVALTAFRKAGLIYEYEVDAGKKLVRVKIPVESLRGYINSVATDQDKALALQALFGLRGSNKL